MTAKEKQFIRTYTCSIFSHIMDNSDTEKITDAMLDDIVTDIEETADPEEWNTNDIDIAITRTLLNKFKIE